MNTNKETPITTKDVLTFSVELGLSMLKSGAEIFRIEESIIRILQAYDIQRFDVYVLSNGIFASANEDLDDACSLVRHMPENSVNLGRIAQLNQLCREICDHRIDLQTGWTRLREIRVQRGYPRWALILACGLGSGCFCYLFGGSAFDGLVACLIGAVEEFLLLIMSDARLSRSIAQIFSSMFVTAVSYLPVSIWSLPLHRDKMIIGAIMVLVPGIMFTTAIRDVYNGDYLSGAIHLLDALLTALCIAAGVVIAIFFMQKFGLEVSL